MKLTLKDFGPIDEFTLDLTKDIQFIYGENSVGKSYAVFVFYALVKGFLDDEFHWRFIRRFSRVDKTVQTIEESILVKIGGGEEDLDITQEVTTIIKHFMSFYSERFRDSFISKFGGINSLSNQYSDKKFYISLEVKNFIIQLRQKNPEIETIVETKGSWEIEQEEDEFSWYLNKRYMFSSTIKHIVGDVIDELMESVSIDIKSSVDKLYSLPASRSGIYVGLNSLTPIIVQLTKGRSRQFANTLIKLPSLSEDVSDFFVNISEINPQDVEEGLSDVVDRIESKILNGRVTFDDKEKELMFSQFGTNLKLKLSETSSMVGELLPVVGFLKYIIKTKKTVQLNLFQDDKKPYQMKNILIIEEPEAHLHPKTQVTFMELLTELPKYGIKLIVTSHSDFMMDKLSNMILEGKVDAETVGSYRMVMGEKGSYDAGDMKAGKDGIPDKNFVEISEKLYEERVDIYDQLNEKNAATEYNKS